MSRERACDRCVGRPWLLRRLGGHLEQARARIDAVLALDDLELIRALAPRQERQVRGELERLDPERERRRARSAGVEAICRCDPAYPDRLRELASPPAVLHVAGGLCGFLHLAAEDPVAIVGARKATPYGLEIARSLGRELGSAGLTILSGMALGIDSAAHAGALDAGAATAAVLPGPAERPYPPGRRALHRRIISTGAAVSELPPDATVWRWTFPARNRIIAALAAIIVVVEAGERSGALLTTAFAHALGRAVGAVPGRVTTPQAAGTNALLASGASIVRGGQDVLDLLFGAGLRRLPTARAAELPPELRELLSAIAAGHDTAAALERAGFPAEHGLAGLAELELSGRIRRLPGGRFAVIP